MARTTDGTGLVFDLTAGEIARLDAGSWFSEGFAGEPVPRLSEVLALEALEFEVQLNGFGPSFMTAAAAAVDEAGALDRCEFTSWSTPMLMALKEQVPAARIGLFSRRREAWMPDALFERTIVDARQFVPAEVVHVHARDITATIVEKLHDLGREVHANDAATAADVRRAILCGADRLSTDDRQTAVAVRRSMRPTVGP